ncbi:MAG: hypothetical protein ACXV97_11135 [Chthoniobacterales bacterium]
MIEADQWVALSHLLVFLHVNFFHHTSDWRLHVPNGSGRLQFSRGDNDLFDLRESDPEQAEDGEANDRPDDGARPKSGLTQKDGAIKSLEGGLDFCGGVFALRAQGCHEEISCCW